MRQLSLSQTLIHLKNYPGRLSLWYLDLNRPPEVVDSEVDNEGASGVIYEMIYPAQPLVTKLTVSFCLSSP